MATIGQQLTSPEASWRRYDDSESKILYDGTWKKYIESSDYNGSANYTFTSGDSIRFKFRGTKLRIIGPRAINKPVADNADIYIDGINYGAINQRNSSTVFQVLLFEANSLGDGEHKVKIVAKNLVIGSLDFGLDAIDIDDIGEILPYVSVPTNLIAAADNSQVRLSWEAVTDTVSYNVKRSTNHGGPYVLIASGVTSTSYVDSDVVNGTTYYYVVTAITEDGVESANSNEASAIPQAPSGHGLLRITMNDSSEREYQLSTAEIDGFINWVKDHVSTDPNCYMLNKIEVLQNSKEYLMFEKIISFEVVPLKD